MNVEWRVSDLVETLRPIAELLGVEGAREVVARFGGMRFHVPKVWREGHFLTSLGDDMSKRLVEHFAGEVLRVPTTFTTQEARIAKARELRKAGHTVNEIARALGLSHRAAQEHLSGAQASPPSRGRRVKDPHQTDIEDFLQAPGARRA